MRLKQEKEIRGTALASKPMFSVVVRWEPTYYVKVRYFAQYRYHIACVSAVTASTKHVSSKGDICKK